MALASCSSQGLKTSAKPAVSLRKSARSSGVGWRPVGSFWKRRRMQSQ